MSEQKTNLIGAYLANGTIGNVGMPGAPIVHFSLVVVPLSHEVSGSVEIKQAVQNGNYSGTVKGKIYATGLGKVTQIVTIQGYIHPDGPMPIEIPFEAHMAIDGSWNGTGGFDYSLVHIDNVPVTPIK